MTPIRECAINRRASISLCLNRPSVAFGAAKCSSGRPDSASARRITAGGTASRRGGEVREYPKPASTLTFAIPASDFPEIVHLRTSARPKAAPSSRIWRPRGETRPEGTTSSPGWDEVSTPNSPARLLLPFQPLTFPKSSICGLRRGQKWLRVVGFGVCAAHIGPGGLLLALGGTR